jgi:glycosyltransferase involved in cell wall biosynthesis
MTSPALSLTLSMLFFDVTKVAGHTHRSGLVRVSQCLRHELSRLASGGVTEVAWSERLATFVGAARGVPVDPQSSDWLTPELFSELERPGLSAWLMARKCRAAAIYHDSIPLQYPEFTWPQSVARHPHYLKMLACFDLVVANSKSSAREIWSYWEWLGVRSPEIVSVPLGADGAQRVRTTTVDPAHVARRTVVMIGILEPRKNQDALLDAAEILWEEGVQFTLQLAGRINPHFGRPVADRLRDLQKSGLPVRHASDLNDESISALLHRARFSVLPSLAEGCGLPVLESLWAGVPAVCSEIPALAESAEPGGCRMVPAGQTRALVEVMRDLLADDAAIAQLAGDACTRNLPTWSDTARAILATLI